MHSHNQSHNQSHNRNHSHSHSHDHRAASVPGKPAVAPAAETLALAGAKAETDDSFHRYAFVKNIRNRIDSFVAPVLNEHLKSASTSQQPYYAMENLVPAVVDKILGSPEYNTLLAQISDDAKRSINHLLEHVKIKGSQDETFSLNMNQELSFSAHSSATYESSSVGSISSGICPGLDELKHMFGHLHPTQSFENRLSAVQRLAAFSIGDMLADEFWPDSKRNMELGLADPDSSSESASIGKDSTSVTSTSEPLDVIATFVKLSLKGELRQSCISRRVLGGYIFFLRQLYRSCEGLLFLEKYQLHTTLAQFRSAPGTSAAALPPVHASDTWAPIANQENEREWNVMLVDNLLNFAATPKGVQLLSQTGSMDPCVSHMFQRYQKKMQVSKCEKFGYGTLVSQLSTAATGTQALWKTGLVQSFLVDLWKLLSADRPFGAPLLDITDHTLTKPLSNVVKIYTSFTALRTCLNLERQFPPTKQSESFIYLVEKLVGLKPTESDSPLVSVENSHWVGLWILKLVTMSSLDSHILMESRFKYQEALLEMQMESFIQTGRVTTCQISQEAQQSKGWDDLPSKSRTKPTVASTVNSDEISPTNRMAIVVASRYAARLLLTDRNQIPKKMSHLFSRLRTDCAQAAANSQSSSTAEPDTKLSMQSAAYDYAGFDWLMPTLFILCNGDDDAAYEFLSKTLATRLPSVFLWSRMPYLAASSAGETGQQQPLGPTSCHLVESILEEEFPMVSSAFTLSGCTPTQMVQRWFRECFWNVLPFPEISNFLFTCILHGIDYQIYFAIALIRHTKDRILAAARDQDLIVLINDGLALGHGFYTHDALEYMHGLAAKYRKMVLGEMKKANGL
eukprot:jgi/Hompol1/1548/HPOL_005322-RA